MTCTRSSMIIAWVLSILVAIFVLIMVAEGSPGPSVTPSSTSSSSPSNLRPPPHSSEDSSSSVHSNNELLWSDEFDGDELNQEYWSYDSVKTVFQQQQDQDQHDREEGDNDNFLNVPLDPVGTDLEYYDPHAISIQDGMLTIATRQVINAGVPFVSGRIKTQDKILFQYGRVEAKIRIRSSCKQGIDICVTPRNLSPSFWTRGSGSTSFGELPTMGQVDIFSVALPRLRRRRRLASNNNNNLEAKIDINVDESKNNLHPWMGHSGATWIAPLSTTTSNGHVIKKSFQKDFPIENWMDQEFHIYKFDWTPTRMATYIDDVLVWEMDITNGSCGDNDDGVIDEDDCQDFHRPHYLLLAISVMDLPSWASSSTSSTMDLSVDYVRLFDNGFSNVSRFPF